jgi:NCAIR mutase (PurE)-related protein
MDRIGKYEDLSKKYMELESCLMVTAKESKRKDFEAVEAELAVKKNEIKVIRIKLDKEREKVKYLDEKLAAMGKHKDQIDTNNTALNRTNMLLIEK